VLIVFVSSDFTDQSIRRIVQGQRYREDRIMNQAHRIPARPRAQALAVRRHPSEGFWRALPLAMALSAGWWGVGLTAVAVLAHYR
jgi:hypothetical protein